MNGISSGIRLPLTRQYFSILLPTSVRDISADRGVSVIYCFKFIGSLYVNWRRTYNYCNGGIEILHHVPICCRHIICSMYLIPIYYTHVLQ